MVFTDSSLSDQETFSLLWRPKLHYLFGEASFLHHQGKRIKQSAKKTMWVQGKDLSEPKESNVGVGQDDPGLKR
jgi:hypothetical protein